MYSRRFENRPAPRRVEIRGRFSLIHLGGGSFLYTLPGRSRPIIGRFDLSSFRLKRHGAMLAALTGVILVGFSVFSNSGRAFTNMGDSQDPTALIDTKNLSPEQMEQKSEELKNRILTEDDEAGAPGRAVITYSVKPGDTLGSVSSRFRVPVHLITKASGIRSDSKLNVGMHLTIPNRPGLSYRIKAGDRLAKVATYYSVKVEDIEKDNPALQSMDLLPVGATVFLPNAKIPEPPPTWSMPAAGRLTSGFGWRPNPVYGYRQFHGGVDIAISYAPVKAARDGVVIFAGPMGSYGNAIIIKHDNVFKTLYAHLSRVTVHNGQQIKRGASIAISGNTGFSTGPHLHFEVIHKGRAVPPFQFVKFR